MMGEFEPSRESGLESIARIRPAEQREAAFTQLLKKLSDTEELENRQLAPIFNEVMNLLDAKIRESWGYNFTRECERKRYLLKVFGLHGGPST